MANRIIGSRPLKSSLQIATARARQIARAEFGRRHDAAAYHCHRDGASWIAEGANQRFDFSRTEMGEVLCISASGGIYLLMVGDDGELTCDCMSAQKTGGTGCKHLHGWRAVVMAHHAAREAVRAALAAEAEAMHRDAAAECGFYQERAGVTE